MLYSFRRCPYAMRARMAIMYSGVVVELREVVLRDMPAHMLAVSPKATVPVLQLPDGEVVDESIDIMHWALQKNDPDGWASSGLRDQCDALVEENDRDFKTHLDHYKYSDRYPEFGAEKYRDDAMVFLDKLEAQLSTSTYLLRDKVSLADVAILPFVRQFSMVDKPWFDSVALPHLQTWLAQFLSSTLFTAVMQKYPAWKEADSPTHFPAQPVP